MEDLVWRYIDGDCTPEEISFVENKIQNDPTFNAEYNEAVTLNALLTRASFTPLSHDFERHLNKKILEVVSTNKSQVLLPTTWIFGLIILAVLGMATALRFQGVDSSYLHIPQIDEKSSDMIAWVITSFLVLVGIDQGFRKWLVFRKQTHISIY
jgi:anti-sigma factor RsiW